jgi:Co/Zn/Cd efflux system component
MDCWLTEREIILVGVLAFVFNLLSLWMLQGGVKHTDLPKGFKKAGLAMQIVGTADGLRSVLGPANSSYRPVLRRSIQKDFVYILGYVMLFVSLGVVLFKSETSAAKWLGLIAAISILGAAVFDLIENFGVLRTIPLNPEEITGAMAVQIRQAALLKWGAFFLTMGLLGSSLLLRSGFLPAIGVLFLLSALLGLLGLRYHQMISLAVPLLGIGLLAIACTFFFLPADVLRKICS